MENVVVSPKQLSENLIRVLKANRVAMIHGSPGIAKSSIVKALADKYNLKLIDKRLSQADPTDLQGFPGLNANNRGTYNPMSEFPIQGDSVPGGYNGWLLFLDELNSAPRAVEAASYKIILDRMVGEYKLHQNCFVIAAGNLDTDGAIVNRLSTASQSRMTHFQLEVSSNDWLQWALDNDIDHRVRGYIKFKPSNLMNFDPNHTDRTFACPRTYEFASDYIKGIENITMENDFPILAGTLGKGVAWELIEFCQVYADLPSIDEIVKNPEGITISQDVGILHALSSSIAHHANEDNIEPLMQFVTRLPLEFQVLSLQDLVHSNPKMLQVPAVSNWIGQYSHKLWA